MLELVPPGETRTVVALDPDTAELATAVVRLSPVQRTQLRGPVEVYKDLTDYQRRILDQTIEEGRRLMRLRDAT